MTAISKKVPGKPLARTKPAATQPSREAIQDAVHEVIHYDEGLHERISKRAYEHYAGRGYRDGGALQDWLDAEREILSREQPV